MKRNYWPTTAWHTLAPATMGMDADKLSGLDSLIKTEYPEMNGIVMVRNGAIVYEKYDHGYGPEDRHHVASVTKSIISALIGIAIDAGYIQHVDRRCWIFFLNMNKRLPID